MATWWLVVELDSPWAPLSQYHCRPLAPALAAQSSSSSFMTKLLFIRRHERSCRTAADALPAAAPAGERTTKSGCGCSASFLLLDPVCRPQPCFNSCLIRLPGEYAKPLCFSRPLPLPLAPPPLPPPPRYVPPLTPLPVRIGDGGAPVLIPIPIPILCPCPCRCSCRCPCPLPMPAPI